MELDLNRAPPGDNRDQEGTSTQVSTQPAQTSQQGISVPPAAIDVDAIDDDVIESSPRAFAEVCLIFILSLSIHCSLVLQFATYVLNFVVYFVRLKTSPEGFVEGL